MDNQEKQGEASNPAEQERVERGVRNPKVIDLISPRGEQAVVLHMEEDRPWSGTDEHLLELEEKINNYFDYVLDGWFHGQYPQYKGREIIIRLACVEPPPRREASLIQEIESFSKTQGLRFELEVKNS